MACRRQTSKDFERRKGKLTKSPAIAHNILDYGPYVKEVKKTLTRSVYKAGQNPRSDKTSTMKESNSFNPSQNETELKIPFFLDVTLRHRVICFRRFVTIFWPHLQGSKDPVGGYLDP